MNVDSATITIIASILTPMLGGFAWILHRLTKIDERLNTLENRMSIVETILAMMGAPIRPNKKQVDQT